jgi:hypothetical protein
MKNTPCTCQVSFSGAQVYRVGQACYAFTIMGRRRKLWRLGPEAYILAYDRPRKVRGAEAENLLRGMLEGRRVSQSYLTAEERKARALRAAQARWGKRTGARGQPRKRMRSSPT